MTAASVALSGSLSRGEARIVNGLVVSDLDLIPVVATVADAALARKQLAPVLQELADYYSITCTAALTLEENFIRVRHAGYVTSMADQPFVWDPLGVHLRWRNQKSLCIEPEEGRPDDVLPWLAQPVTYYVAKAGATAPEENVTKAVRAVLRLLDEAGWPVGIDLPAAEALDGVRQTGRTLRGMADACLRAVRDAADAHHVTLLPSSQELLARCGTSHSPQETFHAVRELAFLENQGLPFQLSAMTARPAH
ncbi:hypothetical protein [Streptomyces sp. NPDC012508]|uniref:hypothetical protein n=1 Tax=Streptomyces sp. NPDC012508 TaxID=3364837 RepID=UPI0036B4925F